MAPLIGAHLKLGSVGTLLSISNPAVCWHHPGARPSNPYLLQFSRRQQHRNAATPRASTQDNDAARRDQEESLDAQIFNIALPTLATLGAEPLASLVSTAWVGNIGAKELAGVGVALSVFGAFTKLFNMPLLAVITSGTATALGKGAGLKSKELGASVSSALALAAGVGLVQAALLGVLGMSGLSAWGAGPSSSIHDAAAAYLSVRALGAPATVLFIAVQGAFRGLGDSRTPLFGTIASNAINVALEPIFIFGLGWGVRGAAAAVAVSQLVACLGLMGMLAKKLDLKGMSASMLNEAWTYIKPTGLLTIRTLAITATYAMATGISARCPPAYAAAHQIAFQLWLASSLLADSLAVAAQSLVARALASPGPKGRKVAAAVSRRVTSLSLGLGVALATGLAVGTILLPLPRLFSSDPGVLNALSALLPAVILTQPLNALAFTMDGILYGVNGFTYAAKAMCVAAVPALGIMAVGSRWVVATHAGADAQLMIVWAGLAAVMGARFLTIYVPLRAKQPPFDQLQE